MEEKVASRRSVAELAGRFKAMAPPPDGAGNEAVKPVRRRPPRSLQLPEIHGDVQEKPSGVTSPLPPKAKRNSALIEKLQANLALSPSALIPSPKSPGFRTLSPTSTTVTTSSSVPTSPESLITAFPLTQEEGPTSFEAPPTAVEGSILSNINKGRARLSFRRRPPSRRQRRSNSRDDIGVVSNGTDMPPKSPAESESKVERQDAEDDGGGDIFIQNEFLNTKSKPESSKPEEEDQSEGSIKPQGGAEEEESTSVQTKDDDLVQTATDPDEGTIRKS